MRSQSEMMDLILGVAKKDDRIKAVFCNRKMLRIAKINAQAKVSIFAGKPKEKTE